LQLNIPPAVADNQPYKNRVNDLSNFAARQRRFILETGGAPVKEGHSPGDFDAMALELFALQFAHNHPYRHFCEGQGLIPANVTHWRNIPAIPAAAFKEAELTSLPAPLRTRVFHSSGTTVHRPSRHFHSAESLGIYEQSLLAGFAENVLKVQPASDPVRWRMIFLSPRAEAAPCSSLAHMFATVRARFGSDDSIFVGRVGNDGGWQLDMPAAIEALKRAGKGPVLMLGTAFCYVHLLDYLAEHPHQVLLPPGSRLMETGGYKGRSRALAKEELHALLRRQLAVDDIICEYGMSELSSQAYAGARGENTPFRFPAWVRVTIVSPETGAEVEEGRVGLVRVFDLANVFSTMAIQTEDLAVRRGAGFELVGRAEMAEARGCSLLAV
jgi:Acyl-protein synthetase, LuxE